MYIYIYIRKLYNESSNLDACFPNKTLFFIYYANTVATTVGPTLMAYHK